MPHAIRAQASRKRKRAPVKLCDKEEADSRPYTKLVDEEPTRLEIVVLEHQLSESRRHLNNVATLLQAATSQESDVHRSRLATAALFRSLCRLLSDYEPTSKRQQDDPVSRWLAKKIAEYYEHLSNLMLHERPNEVVKAMEFCLQLMNVDESSSASIGLRETPAQVFQLITCTICRAGENSGIQVAFAEKFLNLFDDLRYLAVCSIKDAATTGKLSFDECFSLLPHLRPIGTSELWKPQFYFKAPPSSKHKLRLLHTHKRAGQEAWLAALGLRVDKNGRKQALGVLVDSIAPWFADLERLMDFVTDALDAGGATSLIAVSSIYRLMQERNLDYPMFYHKLYSLLDQYVLHSKHRSRFVRLLDTFLASTHLPSVLVASFIKKVARLCLHAPPPAIVVMVPWVYNLLQNHPACAFMLQRALEPKEKSRVPTFHDPFDFEEPDPNSTGAIGSSLWEINSLESHYHPNVATIAKILSQQFTKQAYNIEDFLDHSYETMLDAELSKELKKAPVIEYEIRKQFFESPSDLDDGGALGMIPKIWDFET